MLLPPRRARTRRRGARRWSPRTARCAFTSAPPTARALGDRTVTVEASCADRANVVAVVIAAWEAQQRAEEVQAPSLPRRAPPTVVAVASSPGRLPRRPPASSWSRAQRDPRGRRPLAGGDGRALGLWGDHVGARLGLTGFVPRTESLGAGSAQVDPRRRLRRARRAPARTGRAAGRARRAWSRASSRRRAAGFDVDHQVTQLAPGVGGGPRRVARLRAPRPGRGRVRGGVQPQTLVDTTAEKATRCPPPPSGLAGRARRDRVLMAGARADAPVLRTVLALAPSLDAARARASSSWARAAANLRVEPAEALVTIDNGRPATTRFRAFATIVGRTRRSPTRPTTQWTSDNALLASVDATGAATTGTRFGGETSIRVAWRGETATARLRVRFVLQAAVAPPAGAPRSPRDARQGLRRSGRRDARARARLPERRRAAAAQPVRDRGPLPRRGRRRTPCSRSASRTR